jgi:medium-chain acyl-[acyl-carrier-protein] hydrolase
MTQPANFNNWLSPFTANPQARLRLFCLPFAGEGASLFRQWQVLLGPQFEIVRVQLPGRENRLPEPAYIDLSELVRVLSEILLPLLNKPYAIFGHSMGALIGFELAQRLTGEYDLPPEALLVGGCRAPHLVNPYPAIYNLPESEFLAEFQQRYGPLPLQLINNPELLRIFLPILRADLALVETYSYQAKPALSCPILAYCGAEDRVAAYFDMAAWQDYNQARFKLQKLAGGHFFIKTNPPALLKAVKTDLFELGLI